MSELDMDMEPGREQEQANRTYLEKLKQVRKQGRRQGALITIVVVAVIALLIFLGVVISKIANGTVMSFVNMGSESVITKDLVDKIDAVTAVIEAYYWQDVDAEDLRDGILKGLMEGLGDPYSNYYTAEEYKEMMESSEGIYYGIGAYLQQDPDTMTIKVVRPIKKSPAAEVGLKPEDILTTVDGEDISGQDINLVVSKIRGPVGTSVEIGIYRFETGENLTFNITRAEVESETVEYEMLEDKIGYLRLEEFDDVSTGQFIEAMEDLNDQGMKSLILDLRSNPGGNVDVAVDIADYILPEGLVVYTQDKHGNKEEYKSDATHHFEKPIVILVDGNTASSAEILCGALKDYNRATLVGTNTFGKGIVQQILPLGDGSGIKLTIAEYYTPNGVCIHGEGFAPDVEVELDAEKYLEDGTDTQLDKAIEVIKEMK